MGWGYGFWKRAGLHSGAVTHFDAKQWWAQVSPRGGIWNLSQQIWWKDKSSEHRRDKNITTIIQAVCNDLPSASNLSGNADSPPWPWAREKELKHNTLSWSTDGSSWWHLHQQRQYFMPCVIVTKKTIVVITVRPQTVRPFMKVLSNTVTVQS